MRRPRRTTRRHLDDGPSSHRTLAGTVVVAATFLVAVLALSYPVFVGGVAVGATVAAAAARLGHRVPARPAKRSPPGRPACDRGSRSP